MNELLDDLSPEDGAVIARVRAALDEVTAHAHDHDHAQAHSLVPAEWPRSGVGAGRWLAIAAAAVLIVGAVTAIVVNRSNSTDVASTPTDAAAPTTEPVLIRSEVPWYVLASQDLVPGEETSEPCCSTLPASDTGLVMAWALGGEPANGLLTLAEAIEPSTVEVVGESTRRPIDGGGGGGELIIQSYGITAGERDSLADQIVPGSGLPYVLTAPGWQYVAMGYSGGGERRSQVYIPATTDPLSSYLPTVTITVGAYRGELAWLTFFTISEPVTVAGRDGWKVTNRDGGADVFWPTADGSWATLRIDAAFADRVDGLIAAVIEVSPGAPTVETVPVPDGAPPSETAPGSVPTDSASDAVANITGDALPVFDPSVVDTAIGMPAPAVVGHDHSGNEVAIDPATGPHLVLFVAHWCPHCAADLPHVIEWMADGTIPQWLPVTLVSTAESATAANYPADTWLQEHGWPSPEIRDPSRGDGAAGEVATAYGTSGYPYYVLIGADGTIAARTTGEQTAGDMTALINALPSATIGTLVIPAIGFDSPIVRSSEPTSEPSLSRGPTPDIAHALAVSMIDVGAAAPALDVLRPGDRITWTSAAGTTEFEVTEVFSCTGADCSPENGEPLILFAEQQLTRIFATPVG